MLVFGFLYGIVSTIWNTGASSQIDLSDLLIIGLGSPFALLFIISIQVKNPMSDKKWGIPNWESHPFNLRQPLTFFHFGAFFLMSIGLGFLVSWPLSNSLCLGMHSYLSLWVLAYSLVLICVFEFLTINLKSVYKQDAESERI